jgi:hypothetical protein
VVTSLFNMHFNKLKSGWLLVGFSSNPLQSVEKSFTLSRADQDLLQKPNYDLQVKAST